MIALDSDAFTLAIKGVAQRERKTKSNIAEEQKRAEQGQALLAKLSDDHEAVMISAVSLAEYLVLIDPSEHANQLAELQRAVRIYPVDERAALLAARIRRAVLSNAEVRMAYDQRQRLLKLDAFVLAVAVVNGATYLYSYDAGLAKMAAAAVPGKIKVGPFPVIGTMQFPPSTHLESASQAPNEDE